MSTVEDDGGRWGDGRRGHGGRGGDRERGHGGRGGDRERGHGGRWGDREPGHGGRWSDREGGHGGRGRGREGGHGGRGRGGRRPPTWRATAGEDATGVAQDATRTRLPGEGSGATSVQIESPEPRHSDACEEDAELNKMKKAIQELELKNAELKQKLEVAEAQLNEWKRYSNADPVIEEQVRRCHDVFVCPSESDYQKLSPFLTRERSKLTMDVKVHGVKDIQDFKQSEKYVPIYSPRGLIDSRKKSQKLRRMTTIAKIILLGIIENIYRLHRHGLSLNGKFSLSDLYWTHLKKIKLDSALKLVACQRDRDAMNADYHRIYQIALEILTINDDGLEIPDDLQRLLDLLNSSDPVKHTEIIRYNMSLLSEIGKKSHFLTLYGRLLQQISEDASKDPTQEKISVKVLDFISNQLFTGTEPWSNLAQTNTYVKAAYDRRSLQKGKVLTDPLDLLAVWRNLLSHVLDGSIEDGEPLFKDEDLVHMLEFTVPGVFNELQRAMSEVGLLELPHLMRAMRM